MNGFMEVREEPLLLCMQFDGEQIYKSEQVRDIALKSTTATSMSRCCKDAISTLENSIHTRSATNAATFD